MPREIVEILETEIIDEKPTFPNLAIALGVVTHYSYSSFEDAVKDGKIPKRFKVRMIIDVEEIK